MIVLGGGGGCRWKMAARRATVPGTSTVPPAGRRELVGSPVDSDWFVFHRQDCDKMSGSGMMRDPPAGASSGTAAGEESSDSEGEHEGPQKLIRKVSTSGQIRTKVRHRAHLLTASGHLHPPVPQTYN